MIPVLLAQWQRVVLWGCTKQGGNIQAELFFLDSYLPSIIEVSDRRGGNSYKIEIPPPLQNQLFPIKGQLITLKIAD